MEGIEQTPDLEKVLRGYYTSPWHFSSIMSLQMLSNKFGCPKMNLSLMDTLVKSMLRPMEDKWL